MKTDEILKQIGDKDFLDKIYHFSYHRCNTSHEAEDLCSDIVLAVISAVHKQENIDNFYAFVWTIARRVYADYCAKRSADRQTVSIENEAQVLTAKENGIDEFIETIAEEAQLKKIFSEIAFLSKAYREVMVMYYIDEYKVKDIAAKLGIKETTVKQRLFFARNTIRNEVESMNNRNYALKPVRLAYLGTGKPCGNDPRIKAERLLSQNLIYLCKNEPKSAKELSGELCVPAPYIEEELEIQCYGENGRYGMLRRLENGKYTINVLLADYDEYKQANMIYEKHLPEICCALQNILKRSEEKILSFPYLSRQDSLSFILWSLISSTVWEIEERINQIIDEKHFADITPVEREFTCAAIAYSEGQPPEFNFYGCDGIDAESVCGYRSVKVSNIYGRHIEKHFHCGHNISQDACLLMALKAIDGLEVDKLTEDEKEVAAKAIECGYLRKRGNVVTPKIIVVEKQNEREFYRLTQDFDEEMKRVIQQIAAEISEFMRQHIPAHLMNEYRKYNELIAGSSIITKLIEACIREGILSKPEKKIGAEGVVMIVEK